MLLSTVSTLPPRSRGVLLVQTGRQVGGALGIAALAALLDGSGSGVSPFEHVYLFCTLATFAVAVTALWLVTKERR